MALCVEVIFTIVHSCTTSFDAVGFVRDKRGLEIAWSSGLETNLLSHYLHMFGYESSTGELDDIFRRAIRNSDI